jgi:hypothetical protein
VADYRDSGSFLVCRVVPSPAFQAQMVACDKFALRFKFEKERADVNISLHPQFGDKFSFATERASNGQSL